MKQVKGPFPHSQIIISAFQCSTLEEEQTAKITKESLKPERQRPKETEKQTLQVTEYSGRKYRHECLCVMYYINSIFQEIRYCNHEPKIGYYWKTKCSESSRNKKMRPPPSNKLRNQKTHHNRQIGRLRWGNLPESRARRQSWKLTEKVRKSENQSWRSTVWVTGILERENR